MAPGRSGPTVIVEVECRSGYRGDETPRRFRCGERRLEVAEILAAWVEPDRRCFRVRTRDGDRWRLCHHRADDRWRGRRLREGADREPVR